MSDKTKELLAALEALEQANDDLCVLRTHEMYLAMLAGGQQEALEALDAARRNARALIKQCAAAPVAVPVQTHSCCGQPKDSDHDNRCIFSDNA